MPIFDNGYAVGYAVGYANLGQKTAF